MSFDPEVYVAVNFGMENAHYTWGGEPYNSVIIPSSTLQNMAWYDSIGFFATGIIDGIAGKSEYFYGGNPVMQFAQSDEAKAMIIKPRNKGASIAYASEKAETDKRHAEDLQKVIQNFFFENVFNQSKNTEADWDTYIDELMGNGLGEYLRLYEKYFD
jgi:hypothetical protein